MNYKTILNSSYISQYEKEHCSIYSAINDLTFSVVFLRCQYDFYNGNTQEWIPLGFQFIEKRLCDDVFKHAILKIHRYFFDSSGADIVTISKFHDNVMRNIQPEYKKDISQRIKDSGACTQECKQRLEDIKKQVQHYRCYYLAHNIPCNESVDGVLLDDLEFVLEIKRRLFEILSFTPLDFYQSGIHAEGIATCIKADVAADISSEYHALKGFCQERISFIDSLRAKTTHL